MHDLRCSRAEEMYNRILAERVHELKEAQEGVDHMCREMEQLYNDGIEMGEKRGEKRGELKAKKEMAVSLAAEGMKAEQIARLTKVSVGEVQKWINERLSLV